MHKPESVQENKAHEFLSNFEIQTNHPVLDRRPDLVLIIIRPQIKIERKRKES